MANDKELSPKQIDAKLNEFEQKLEQLHRAYEQYFIGVESRLPQAQRRDVVRLMRELGDLFISSTAQKFRLRSAQQRFNSYKSYWNRVQKQIENGTYHRDQKRARRRQQARERREQALEQAQRPAAGQADDGAFDMDLGELSGVDLSAMEKQLEEIDARGGFDKYSGTAKIRRREFPEDRREARSEAQPHQEIRGRAVRRDARTGPQPARPGADSSGSNGEQRRGAAMDKLRRAREKLQRATEAKGRQQDPSKRRIMRRGAGARAGEPGEEKGRPPASQKRRIIRRGAGAQASESSEEKRRQQARQQRRIIRRGAGARAGESRDDKARRVYNNLIAAKRRCNEDTSGLSYESVKRSMDQQASRLKASQGGRQIDFKVVIKDGSAYIKPESK